jgi:lipopolysaccharide biosynthesis glycosyltransferase
MKWFTGLNSHNKSSYSAYIDMYKVAVHTAKKTNPKLEPFLILDGEEDDEIRYLKDKGVNVIHHRSFFFDALKDHYKDNTTAFGAFIRIDIPKICENLNIKDEYILYTDNDVFFMDNISELKNLKPKFFSVSGEFFPNLTNQNMNSGVMWINLKSMLEIYDDFINFIKNNLNLFNVYDQDALKIYFKDKMDVLDPLYNFKPYWGGNKKTKILHFHGPKPTFNEDQLKSFPFQNLITPYFIIMKDNFNQILKTL